MPLDLRMNEFHIPIETVQDVSDLIDWGVAMAGESWKSRWRFKRRSSPTIFTTSAQCIRNLWSPFVLGCVASATMNSTCFVSSGFISLTAQMTSALSSGGQTHGTPALSNPLSARVYAGGDLYAEQSRCSGRATLDVMVRAITWKRWALKSPFRDRLGRGSGFNGVPF